MDARIERTLKKIDEAYWAEKRHKDREQIRVSDICSRAGINRTTFYNHYCDIFALADKIERELLEEIVSSCQHADKVFSEPRLLFTELLNIAMEKEDKIRILFHKRYNDFISKHGEVFVEKHGRFFPTDRERRIMLLCLSGSSFLLERDFSEKNVRSSIDLICEIIRKLR